MSNKKSYKGGDVVLTIHGKEDLKVTPSSFDLHSYSGVTVSGETYYVSKALKLGAKKRAAKKKPIKK